MPLAVYLELWVDEANRAELTAQLVPLLIEPPAHAHGTPISLAACEEKGARRL
jgi:hypothetical protein